VATAIDQGPRLLSIDTPLGDDVLVLQSFTGSEAFSSLFSFHLEMLSSNDAIAPPEIVSKSVTVRINLTDGSQRFFNGHVNQFIGGAMHTRELRHYRAEVVPWLWFLTRSTDCRIFQSKSAPQIIEQIFQDLGFSGFEMDLQGLHPERVYCVQYRESAFSFVSRLMEEEGMFYWFRQADGRHTLVIADHKGAYTDCPENEIECHPGSLTPDHISQWEHCYEYRSGKYDQTDYNFETPSSNLHTRTNTLIDLPQISSYELYDYPGGYQGKGDGESLTRIRMEEDEVPHDVVRCDSGCRSLHPGGKFTLTRHECSSEEGKGYVITSIQHSANDQTQLVAGGETYYENSFECIPDGVVFRPGQLTPRPKIRGPQTAVVVGPAGEEIYPDEYGRVKTQFHWDRKGKNDENSSCWVRVSQVHAGKGFGGIDIPRIGDEVIVEFLEGDPDRPIITGRVYNAEQMPPYPLPGKKVISGLKSNSTKGGGGYNEYVFDDSKGHELIREHGQFDKDSTIENDLREHVLHDRSRDVTNDETIVVGNDRSKSIGNNETTSVGVNRTEKVGSNEDITIGANRTEKVGSNESIDVGANRTRNVGKDEMVTVGATRTLTVADSQDTNVGTSHTESIGKDHSETIGKNQSSKIGENRSTSVGKDDALQVGKNLVIDAGDSVVIKTGKASLSMKKDGTITIQGKDITVKGSGGINIKASKNVVIKGKKVLQN
jgi:type VI secretion system secreted protein VgrG